MSVIIPAFNASRFIAETIESVLRQSFSSLEIVVVDNLSTDNTAEIAQRYSDLDQRVKLRQCEIRGAAAARNVGIKNSCGDYIQFLDADDLLSTKKIEKQLQAMNGRDPIYTLSSCPWYRFTAEPADVILVEEPLWPIENSIEWLTSSLSGEGMMQTACWLAHRELIESAGPWNEELSLHDDGEFFTRVLLQAKSQVYVPEAKVYYRAVSGSLSRQRGKEAVNSAFQVCKLRDSHLLAASDTPTSRSAIATQYAQFIYEFSREAPELARMALNRMGELGEKPANSVGGGAFRVLNRILGFPLSIAVRTAVQRLV